MSGLAIFALIKPYILPIIIFIGAFFGVKFVQKAKKDEIENEQFKRAENDRKIQEHYQQSEQKKQIEFESKQKTIQEWRNSIDLDLLSRDPVAKRMYETDPLRFDATYYPGQQFTRTEPEKKIE